MTGGFNQKGYKGKYSGSAGKNKYRNPQPGFGGSSSPPRKGCDPRRNIVAMFLIFMVVFGIPAAGIWAITTIL